MRAAAVLAGSGLILTEFASVLVLVLVLVLVATLGWASSVAAHRLLMEAGLPTSAAEGLGRSRAPLLSLSVLREDSYGPRPTEVGRALRRR